MRLGLAGGFQKIAENRKLGFDYIEVGVGNITKLSESEFAELAAQNDEATVKIEAASSMLPASLPVAGPNVDLGAVEAYLDLAFSRLSRLGVEPVVFGSGGARKIPEGFDRAEAQHQLITAGRMMARKAGEYGLVIALEPLFAKATNTINSQMAGIALVEDVDRPQFQLLADLFHMAYANESREAIRACGSMLVHTHIPNAAGPFLDQFPGIEWEDFFAGLADIGYKGRLSLEDNGGDGDAMNPQGLARMRELAAKYGL
ncbi:MAG: sugar phosphate isomerase/epimerase [Ruminococcaceae bacterium]|nr:sugar phosphate isomerase/epimerase [Oscillospiraceae bacterium]MBQ4047907.1 sugar phosphate isomerase/epimerase [Clostridia bacterium]